MCLCFLRLLYYYVLGLDFDFDTSGFRSDNTQILAGNGFCPPRLTDKALDSQKASLRAMLRSEISKFMVSV